jgi:4-hydroxythreonine-4-phosphate dehydrogenase
MGDPAGIGPEICLRACADPAVRSACRPLIIGDAAWMAHTAAQLTLPSPPVVGDITALQSSSPLPSDAPAGIIDLGPIAGAPQSGRATAQSGRASLACIEASTRAALAGTVAGICTAPITKATLDLAGIEGPGHTEIFARLTGTTDYAMMLTSPRITVSLVTIHQSLASVPGALSTAEIVRIARLTRATMRRLRGTEPRLAILGLNPHAGEEGLMGNEEIEIIAPAVAACRAQGMDIEGPLPPDAAFLPRRMAVTDAHICMYHDQGLIPFKMISSHDGVNLTMGLPIVRTSPDHGTAYAIAGRGEADPSSMIAATRLAARLAAAPPAAD